MSTNRTLRLASGLFAFALLFPLGARGAEVVLTSGDVLEGEIVTETPQLVTIKMLSKTMAIPRARIKEVRQSKPGMSQLRMAADALRKDDLATCRAQIEAAVTAGAPEANVKEMRDKADARETEMEMARYAKLISAAQKAAATGTEAPELQQINDLLKTLPPQSPIRKQIVNILCDYHIQRADEHRDKVRNTQAIQELNQALALDPQRAAAYIDLGDLYRTSSGTWPQAIERYGQALKVGKETVDKKELTRVHWEMAEIHRQRSEWAPAAMHYREAFTADPSINLRLKDRLIESYRAYAKEAMIKEPVLALRVVDDGLKVRPDPELMETKGLIYRQMQRWPESTDAFLKLLAINPATRNINYYIAQNYFAQGEILNGRESLAREVEVYPNNYDALCLIGDYALQRDDYPAAESAFTKARDVDNDKPRASLGLGKASRLQSKLPDARKYVGEVLSRLPDDREANLEMGRILRDENNLEEAKDYFTRVLDLIDLAPKEDTDTLKPLKADALIARGEVSLLTTGPGTANIDFRKALEVLPTYGQAYYSIGNAYRKKFASSKRLEDLKIAEDNLLKARQFAPQNPQFALDLGILYAQELAQIDTTNAVGYRTKARTNWDAYISLGGANAAQVRTWISELGGA